MSDVLSAVSLRGVGLDVAACISCVVKRNAWLLLISGCGVKQISYVIRRNAWGLMHRHSHCPMSECSVSVQQGQKPLTCGAGC